MREGWKEVRLGDVISTNKSNLNKNYKFEKILYVDISSVGSGDISFNDEILLNEAPSRAKRLVKNGDTIISSVRPANRNFAYFKEVPHNLVVSTGFTTLHPNVSEINSRYLYYLISNEIFTEYLVSVEKGANYPAVTAKDIEDYVFNLPPLETQKKIASILSGYDDLIENNLKRIKILEEMAQQTYEEWFVRMRFPGHESATINSETGLPEGWEKVKLGEVCNFNQGLQVPIDNQFTQFSDDLIRFIRIVDVTQNTNDIRYVKTPKKLNQFVNFKDVFMVRYGAPQVVTNYKGIIANNFFRININDESILKSKFLFSFLNRNEIRENLLAMSVSATMPAISFKSFSTIEIILPSIDLQTRFHNDVDMSYDLILNLQIQNQRLREARDILLPRLMMGMVEV